MAKYIIIYDIPRERKVLQVQVNRLLKKMRSDKIQHSTWESEDLEGLRQISKKIRDQGGQALILEKKVVT
jgi:CRISPR/Cas system-associated endoribonuclease Cas2